MNKSDYNGVYEELVELPGLENTLKIHKHFRGQQVNFPMRLYSKEYIEEYLIKNYNGKNLKELSKNNCNRKYRHNRSANSVDIFNRNKLMIIGE